MAKPKERNIGVHRTQNSSRTWRSMAAAIGGAGMVLGAPAAMLLATPGVAQAEVCQINGLFGCSGTSAISSDNVGPSASSNVFVNPSGDPFFNFFFGNGADGTAENPNGGNGGIFFGNGGNGFSSTTPGVAGGNGGAGGFFFGDGGNGGNGAAALVAGTSGGNGGNGGSAGFLFGNGGSGGIGGAGADGADGVNVLAGQAADGADGTDVVVTSPANGGDGGDGTDGVVTPTGAQSGRVASCQDAREGVFVASCESARLGTLALTAAPALLVVMVRS